jgi:AAA15 family ATPase/GTPase
MNYLEEVSIKGGVFFKDFVWKDIPKLAVISGVNGSGKTLLLKAIDPVSRHNTGSYELIGVITKPEIDTGVFFVPFDSVKNNEIENIDTSFTNGVETKVIDSFKGAVLEDITKAKLEYHYKGKSPSIPGYIERVKAEYYPFYDKKANKNKDLWELSDEQMHDFAYKIYPLTNKKYLNLATIFLYFKQQENEFKADLFNSTDDEKNKKLKEKLKSFFGIDEAPWVSLNNFLKEKNFKYTITEPKNVFTYQPLLLTKEGNYVPFYSLSSGERIIIRLLIWAWLSTSKQSFWGNKTIFLLDEFDAHLNPELAELFMQVVRDLVENNNLQIILTTHSPSTIAYCKEEELFWMEEGQIKKGNKNEIIEKLTPGILTFRADTLVLLTSKPNIIFTEGETDIVHIKTAIEVLSKENKEFEDILEKAEFIPAHSAERLKSSLNAFNSKKKSINVIGIFDYDKEGIKCFNALDNLNKKTHKLQMLPVNKEFQLGVEHGYFPIEFLFKRDFLEKKGLIMYPDPKIKEESDKIIKCGIME